MVSLKIRNKNKANNIANNIDDTNIPSTTGDKTTNKSDLAINISKSNKQKSQKGVYEENIKNADKTKPNKNKNQRVKTPISNDAPRQKPAKEHKPNDEASAKKGNKENSNKVKSHKEKSNKEMSNKEVAHNKERPHKELVNKKEPKNKESLLKKEVANKKPLDDDIYDSKFFIDKNDDYKNKTILHCNGVSKKIGFINILNDCDFSVKKGECITILAPENNGKTTLAKILCGLVPPNSGNVSIKGKKAGYATNSIVSYFPEIPFVKHNSTIAELLTQYSRFFSDFSYKRAFNLLKDYNLSPKTKFENLSTTAIQLIEAIVVSSRRASVFIYDDPLIHTDPKYRDDIIEIISKGKKSGSLIILSQVATGLDDITDRTMFLRKGEITLSYTKQQFEYKYGKSVSALYKEVFRNA